MNIQIANVRWLSIKRPEVHKKILINYNLHLKGDYISIVLDQVRLNNRQYKSLSNTHKLEGTKM